MASKKRITPAATAVPPAELSPEEALHQAETELRAQLMAEGTTQADKVDQIVSHLKFHGAIIRDGHSDQQRITDYVALVQELEKGMHIPVADPFHKSLAIAFELVLQNHLDPWNIDLLKFSHLFLERVRTEEDIDFITAGKLLLMAWEILRRQAEEVLDSALRAEEARKSLQDAQPEGAIDVGGSWMNDDSNFAFTTTLMERDEPPLTDVVLHQEERPVTLMELVDAFEEARKESEVYQILTEERRKERERLEAERDSAVRGMVHKEDLEGDKHQVWTRIESIGDAEVPIETLYHQRDLSDVVSTLISCLFLAREERVLIRQDDFPRGTIYVKRRPATEPAAPMVSKSKQRAKEGDAEAPAADASA